MSEHTQGPWKVSRNGNRREGGFNIGQHPAHLQPDGSTYSLLIAGAVRRSEDARLIAAAPDLLEAAKLVVARWETGDLAEAVRSLSVAIAKAEGDE